MGRNITRYTLSDKVNQVNDGLVLNQESFKLYLVDSPKDLYGRPRKVYTVHKLEGLQQPSAQTVVHAPSLSESAYAFLNGFHLGFTLGSKGRD